MTRVYVEEAGCDRRRLDVQSIRRFLEVNGYEIVDDPALAEKIVLATCAFKQGEEEASLRRVRKMRRYDGELIVYGCLPDIAGARYPELDDVESVAPRTIESIGEYFDEAAIPFAQVAESNVLPRAPLGIPAAKRFLRGPIDPGKLGYRLWSSVTLGPAASAPARMPFNLFVSRGCLGSCSYCAIPRSIGTVHSKPLEAVLAEFEQGIAAGHRVFNILGDDPGCWGLDAAREFPELVAALLKRAGQQPPEQAVRLWIREIHPKYLVRYGSQLATLPGFSAIEGILVPVQSGSDRVLELMQREHTAERLSRTIAGLRDAAPGLRIETQMIVGFPTETEADLAATLEFVCDTGFDSVVVFPYHDKPDTVSSALDGKIGDAEIKRRMRTAFKHFRAHGVKAYYSCP